jgi:hypothetical protein
MIEYIANYYGAEKRPYICKKFVASNEEESHTPINVGNEADRDLVSAETIYEHMNNVLHYLDEKMDMMTLVQLDELNHNEPWPIKGWSEVEWCQTEIVLWWEYIYYKDFNARVEAKLQEDYEAQIQELMASGEWVEGLDHTHDGTEDHTHDPETGEEIPTTTTEEGTQP